MIRFQPSVSIYYFNKNVALVLELASIWSLRTAIDVDVNSVADGTHGPASLHPFDLAVDLDTKGDRPEDLGRLHKFLMVHLPRDYDVVLESTHVHVEYDIHR